MADKDRELTDEELDELDAEDVPPGREDEDDDEKDEELPVEVGI